MVMTSKLCTQRCSFLSPTRERKQLEHVCHLFQYNTRVLAHLCVGLRTSVQLKLSETATKKKLRLFELSWFSGLCMAFLSLFGYV